MVIVQITRKNKNEQEQMETIEVQLPLEQDVNVPNDLIINFDNIDGQTLSNIDDEFNDLGMNIPRDNSSRVEDVKELFDKFNDYDYTGSSVGKCVGVGCVCFTLGCYLMGRRHMVPAGYFGHYVSSGRHMLKKPGIHAIISSTDKWKKMNNDVKINLLNIFNLVKQRKDRNLRKNHNRKMRLTALFS